MPILPYLSSSPNVGIPFEESLEVAIQPLFGCPQCWGIPCCSSLVEVLAQRGLGVGRSILVSTVVSPQQAMYPLPPFLPPQVSFSRMSPSMGGTGATLLLLGQGCSCPGTHLCLHQVDPLCPELTHTVEDVHYPFILGHVKHGVNSDEAAGPPGPSTGREDSVLC